MAMANEEIGVTTEHECDQLLVKRVQAGDRGAFDLLVKKYQYRLIRLVLRLVQNQAEAEDIVQETFINAFRGISYFRAESSFYTWLYQIGVNAAKNFLAVKGKRPSSSLYVSLQYAEATDDSGKLSDINTPESLLRSKQIAYTINNVVERLPLDLQIAITLREIEGLSYEEISKVMVCPVGTVRSRIFRARDVIADNLKLLLDSPVRRP